MAIINNSQVMDRTSAIEKIPHYPSLIGSLSLFRDETVGSDAITFDVRDNHVAVLDDKLRNTMEKNGDDPLEYNIHTMAVPHYPMETAITRKELSGIRGFGRETEEFIEQKVAGELEHHANTHDYHLEYLRSLMLCQGKVDTNFYGTIDMYKEFGVTKPTAEIDTAAGKDLAAQFRAITRQSQDALNNGGRVAGFTCLCGVDFFDAVVFSDQIKQAYQFAQTAQNPLQNQLGEVGAGYVFFRFGNIDFIVYPDTFKNRAGTSIKPLADGAAVLFPRTTLGTSFFAPVSKLSGVGSMGAKRFASTYRDPKDRYVEVESEQNTLIINKEIASVIHLTIKSA